MVEDRRMIYDYIYELITTLFIDPDLLSPEGLVFLEIMMIYLSAILLRFMLTPIFIMFKVAAAQYKAIGGPKTRIRARSYYDKD
jgi:hypothetical protein